MARPKVYIDPRQGERLREVLREQNITQNALAQLVNSSRQSISRYVTCKDKLQDYIATAIADEYGYNPAWLLCIDDRKFITAEEDKIDQLENAYKQYLKRKSVEAFLADIGYTFVPKRDVPKQFNLLYMKRKFFELSNDDIEQLVDDIIDDVNREMLRLEKIKNNKRKAVDNDGKNS